MENRHYAVAGGLRPGRRRRAAHRVPHHRRPRPAAADRRAGPGDGTAHAVRRSPADGVPRLGRPRRRRDQRRTRRHRPGRVRLHVCWGNYEGPHTHDVPLDDIQPLLYEAHVGALVLSMANARHAHEHHCFERLPLPDAWCSSPASSTRRATTSSTRRSSPTGSATVRRGRRRPAPRDRRHRLRLRHVGRDRRRRPVARVGEARRAPGRRRPGERPVALTGSRTGPAVGRSAWSAASRSRQRSSTSSMPTLMRSSPGGDVGCRRRTSGAARSSSRRRRGWSPARARRTVVAHRIGGRRAIRGRRTTPSRRCPGTDGGDRRVGARAARRARRRWLPTAASRTGSVRRPRRARNASSEPGVAPWNVRAWTSRSCTASSAVTHSPISRSLWPPMNFVAAVHARWPRRGSSGRCRSGVANVESTTTTRAGRDGAGRDRRQVGDVERRVRRRLDPHDVGAVGRADDRVGVGDVDRPRLDRARAACSASRLRTPR